MASRIRLRLLADYFAATRNEVATEEMFLALSKTQAAKVGHLPRVPHWIALASRHPCLTRALSRMARVFWLFGGAVLYFSRDYLKFSFMRRSTGAFVLPRPEGAILGLSTRIYDILKPSQFPSFPRVWLTLPWLERQALPDAAKELPLLSLLSQRDFLTAIRDAIAVTHRMQRHRSLSPWVLQTYTAFRWFLVRRAIDRVSGPLVTAEHYDRWAVLVDRSVRECRRSLNCSVRMILVQHGAMGALSGEAVDHPSSLNLPTRLRQTDELHAYNNNEVAAFLGDVFARPEISRPLDIQFFKPTIELTGAPISNRPRLLFVGHPLCESFHVEAFLRLKALKAFDVFYKPHPLAPMSASIAGVGWTIINEASLFPKVNLLVSYPSTLVIEYESVGIPATVHPLDARIDDLSLFVEKIQNFIENQKNS